MIGQETEQLREIEQKRKDAEWQRKQREIDGSLVMRMFADMKKGTENPTEPEPPPTVTNIVTRMMFSAFASSNTTMSEGD